MGYRLDKKTNIMNIPDNNSDTSSVISSRFNHFATSSTISRFGLKCPDAATPH